jgi:hypothetical protein
MQVGGIRLKDRAVQYHLAAAILGLLLAFAGACRGEVVVYPGPTGVDSSDQYAVELMQEGRVKSSFVYMTRAQWRSNRSKTTSWTTFSFAGSVTIRVRKLKGLFETCRILPSSYGIEPDIDSDCVTFRLDRPRKISVEFDDDITHPLLIFANPLEKGALSRSEPGVIYFGPGVHEIGAGLDVPSNTTVYLAGGAYVKGRLRSRDSRNIKVVGRGILSGEQLERQSEHLIRFRNADSVLIEGITLVNSPHYNISLRGDYHTVRNVKMIGWYFSTDGVCTGYHGLVEDCFFKVNDDAVKLYFSDMVVRKCVIWQMENGAPFQISWNMPSDNSNFHVSDIDVIRVEHEWDNPNEAVFDAIHGGRGHMSNYLFENIRIENADWRLFYITIDRNEFADSSRGMGRISNVVFRNITVRGPMKRVNVIRGWDADHQVRNVLFENVRLNGRYIDSPAEGCLEIDPNTAENITFKVPRRAVE